MKTFTISLVSSVCVIAALALPQASSAQVVFQTTFDHATFPDQHTAQKGVGHHWEVSDYFLDYPGPLNRPCLDGSCGVKQFGGWWTKLGGGGNQPTGDDVIHTNANNQNGGGGKGFRHWRGNGATGQNDNGGGLGLEFPSVGEFWIRFYMRYQSGFTWGPSGVANPGYTKDMRNESPNGWVFGIQGGASWGITDTVAGHLTSSKSWTSTMGGFTGDGLWHCFEFHWRNGTGSRIEMWVDDQKVMDTIANTSTDLTNLILLGDNQNGVGDSKGFSVSNGGTPTDWYTDYDDIVISTGGRVGCVGSVAFPAPRNLRVQ